MIGQQLSTELEDMPAADQRHHIGCIEAIFNIDRVCIGTDPGGAGVAVELKARRQIGYRIVPAQILRVVLVQTRGFKPVALPRESNAELGLVCYHAAFALIARWRPGPVLDR